MFEITCPQCNAILGTTSKPVKDGAYECSACYEERNLEAALKQGKIFNHKNLDDVRLERVVGRVGIDNLKNNNYGIRIASTIKKIRGV